MSRAVPFVLRRMIISSPDRSTAISPKGDQGSAGVRSQKSKSVFGRRGVKDTQRSAGLTLTSTLAAASPAPWLPEPAGPGSGLKNQIRSSPKNRNSAFRQEPGSSCELGLLLHKRLRQKELGGRAHFRLRTNGPAHQNARLDSRHQDYQEFGRILFTKMVPSAYYIAGDQSGPDLFRLRD